MEFVDIQDEVKSDRFSEDKRENIKRWINYRYGRLWAQEPWSFKLDSVSATLAASADSVSLDALGLQRILSVWDASTFSNTYREQFADRPEDFHKWASRQDGRGYSFTVLGGELVFDRPMLASTDIVVVGEIKFSFLVADDDTPLLPEEFHYMLVHGAASEGLRLENDPTWQGFEQDWQAGIIDLQKGYLTAVRSYGDSYPAWP